MKKINSLILCIFCINLLVGCTEKKEENLGTNLSSEILLDEEGASAICKVDNDYSEQGYVTGSKFVIYADDQGIVTRIKGEEIVASNDKSLLNNLQQGLDERYSILSQYEGYTYSIKITGNKLFTDTDIDYTKLDLAEMSQSQEDFKVYLNEDNQLTLSSVQAIYMDGGATCTEKKKN